MKINHKHTMVLIIKARTNPVNDMKQLAGQMVNMEINQHVYDDYGVPKFDIRRPKFNTYTHNSVNFEFVLGFGIIILYVQQDGINYISLITEEIKKMGVPKNVSEMIHHRSDYYTFVKSAVVSKNSHGPNTYTGSRQKCFRKIISDPYYLNRAISGDSNHFVWLVITKPVGNFRGSYLKIPEMDPKFPSELYLNKSICTILYDGVDMFGVPSMTKQINYPALEQYNMFKRKQIIQDPIYISWTGGLRFEIFRQFRREHPIYWCDMPEDSPDFTPEDVKELKVADVQLKRLNPDKPWRDQLKEPFDYQKQEEDEVLLVEEGKSVFPNDVCFISKIPLWEKFYIVRIKNATSEFDIAVAPSAFHVKWKTNKKELLNIKEIIESGDNDLKMLSFRVCSHPRTFLEVLDMIDVNPVKKNIMRCMEFYGCYCKVNDYGNRDSSYSRYARQYYVIDKNSSQVYVGVIGVNDSHISLYQNTDTILFRVVVLGDDTLDPDPLQYPDSLFDQ